MTTIPTTIAVSSQNWNGKSWTSRSVAGSNRYEPGREEDLVEELEQPVEGDQPHDPDDHDADRQPDRPAPHRTPRSGPIRAAGSRRPARPRRSPARIHRPRKTDRTSAMWACSRSLRTGWPFTWTSKIATEHEVGQDRVGGRRAARSAVKPVQAAACARSCSKATHCGLRNGRIVTRDDDDRGREADQDGRGTAADGVHGVILARLAVEVPAGPRRLLVLERPRLVPPALEGEVAGRVHPEFGRGAPDALAERVEVEVEDVLEALDPAWIISWCSSGPKLARLSISASSRQVRTSFVSAAIWSARVWRRVGVSETSSSRPVVKMPDCRAARGGRARSGSVR